MNPPAPEALARELAVEVLLDLRRDRHARELLAERTAERPRREAALASELVYGSLRHRGTLDHLLGAHYRHHRPERAIEEVLRVGAYQLLFLDRVPAHAAVDEAVEAARRRSPRAAGFVNATLRSLQRALRGRTDTPCGPLAGRSRRSLPLPGGGECLFREDLLPDPAADAVAYLAAAYSHPRWLVSRWAQRLDEETLLAVLDADNQVPLVSLRANRRRASPAELVAALAAEGVEAGPGAEPDTVLSAAGGRPDLWRAHRDGLCTVQDASQARVALALGAAPGERVLDLCAAPGGKATHLAELADDRALVVASDLSPERLSRVREGARRLGLSRVALVASDALRPAFPPAAFHRVLLDAPCTNTGVLARRPEARWRVVERDVWALSDLQLRLLAAAAPLVAQAGRLVYSVCSIEDEEGPHAVRAFVGDHPGFALEAEEATLPGPEAGGGYLAVLLRTPRG
ncbi:MAG: 16S rRNA (cytosine(967)-C(5))-methyltransferase RsmB [Planctomycetes bacterium]|nr:16S rRNA (cytosine(967)-C(5))-methyltransferase RsmB [Planctomycetota bacterium]